MHLWDLHAVARTAPKIQLRLRCDKHYSPVGCNVNRGLAADRPAFAFDLVASSRSIVSLVVRLAEPSLTTSWFRNGGVWSNGESGWALALHFSTELFLWPSAGACIELTNSTVQASSPSLLRPEPSQYSTKLQSWSVLSCHQLRSREAADN